MQTISLAPILLQYAELTDAGTMFYNQIITAIKQDEKIVVDMENVTALPSIFLNVSIGKIIEELGVDALKQNLSFVKITKAQALRLKEYLIKFSA